MSRARRQRKVLNRHTKRQSKLAVERLEDRRVLAGNVTASVNNGNLTILGDAESNQVLVTRNADLSVTISSIDGSTTINGQAGPLTLANARENLTVNMGAGDDVIRFAGTADLLFRMYGNAAIDLGAGNDEIGMSNFSVWKNFALSGGSGDDRIIGTRDYIGGNASSGWGLRVGGATYISGDDGNDQLRLKDGEYFGDFIANLGAGGDLMSICTSRFRDDLALNGGTGNDNLYSNGNTFVRPAQMAGWESADNTSCGPPIDNPEPSNLPPVAANDNFTLDEGASGVINVAANDVDVDGTIDLTSIVIVQQPTNGTVTVNNNGTVTYTHNGSETTSDTFSYTIKDNNGTASNPATVNITVNPVDDTNEPPVAVADSATVNEGASGVINLAGNDTDTEGQLDLTSIVIVQQPTNGTVTVNSNGTVTYTHNGSSTTTDSFSYTIADAAGNVSNVAVVTIAITPIDDSPIAVPDTATVDEGGSISINVAGNDTDTEGQLDLASIVITQQPTNGTVTVNPNGTVVYTHNGSETTSDSFQYTIQDAAGNTSAAATVTITVNPVADPPVATDDTATVNEGGTQPINVAANDSDDEGPLDLTSIVITQQPTFGTVTVNADGTVTYVHDGSETTTDSFRYTIQDASGTVSNEATVTLTITPVSDTPIANADSATVDQGASTVLNLAGNDTDAEGDLDLTSIVITQDPANGSITINPNGTVIYTHDGSATTSDTFRYTIRDAQGNTSTEAIVTITINADADQDPVAVDDTATVEEGGTELIDVAANDTDAEGPVDPTTVTIITPPTNGTATVNPDGTISYTHDGSETTTDTLTYTIQDANGNVSNVATLTITITPVDDAPVAEDDAATVGQGTSLNIDVAGNDTDEEGALDPTTVTIVTPPTNGTATVNPDGTIAYTHDGSATTTDTFTYTIEDANGNISNVATVTITITPADEAPVAEDDTATVDEGDTVNIDVAANDTDAEGPVDPATVTIVTQPVNGTATVNPDGTISYTHDGSETTTDTLTYTIQDANGNISNTATVTITITPVDDAPVAEDDTATVDEGDSVNIDVAANDTDPEGAIDPAAVTIVTPPTNGTATVNPDGTIAYTHDDSETTTDTLTYTIQDANGNISNTATVTITITPVDDAPVAEDDTATVDEGDTIDIDVATNDTDEEGAVDPTTVTIVTPPMNGTATVNPDGTISYTHDGSETTTDTLTYTVEDANGNVSNVATVTITITPVDDAPVAEDDTATVDEGDTIDVDVATNDTDEEGAVDPTTVTIVTPPVNGTATVNPDGTISYTHDGSETTSDTLTYTVEDANGNVSNVATVTITITPVDDAPVAEDDTATVDEGDSVNIDVLANDTDEEGALDATSVVVVDQPANGTATVNADGTITYTHDGSETTTDSFTYTVEDASGNLSNTATVTVTITPVNDPPVAEDDTGFEVTENSATPVLGDVLLNDTDGGDGGPLAVSGVGGGSGNVGVDVPGLYGTFNIAADGSFIYTLDEDNPALADLDDLEELIDSIAYSITDGTDEDEALLSITINGVTD